MKNKFELGNIVRNLYTGVDNTYSTIISIESARYYLYKQVVAGYNIDNHPWHTKFPNWLEECVYVCKSQFAVKTVSYLEYCSHYKIPSNDKARGDYDKLSETFILAYTEQDLELYLEHSDLLKDEHLVEMGYKEK